MLQLVQYKTTELYIHFFFINYTEKGITIKKKYLRQIYSIYLLISPWCYYNMCFTKMMQFCCIDDT